jgi:hypothetical protein
MRAPSLILSAVLAAVSAARAQPNWPDIVKQAEEMARNEVAVASFSNWRIKHILSNNSYILIGVGDIGETFDNNKDQYFHVQCFANSPSWRVSMPIWRSAVAERMIISLQFWNDAGATGEIETVNFRNATALGEALKDGTSVPGYREFLSALISARHTFSLSYPGKTLKVNTDDLAPALSKLRLLCPMTELR